MKFGLLFLCILLVFGLCACGNKIVPDASPEGFATREVPFPEATTGPTLYENLLAWVETEEEAQAIADAYGIELCTYGLNVATFHTDEDPLAVIRRGREQGLPELSVNGTIQTFC